MMTDKEFRAFLDLLMCSDPWPVNDGGKNQVTLKYFADVEASKRHYDTWIEAYHYLEVK